MRQFTQAGVFVRQITRGLLPCQQLQVFTAQAFIFLVQMCEVVSFVGNFVDTGCGTGHDIHHRRHKVSRCGPNAFNQDCIGLAQKH